MKLDNIHNTFTVSGGKSKMVSFASSIMKNIIVLSFAFSPPFRFLVKLICCIAFGSALSGCCLL